MPSATATTWSTRLVTPRSSPDRTASPSDARGELSPGIAALFGARGPGLPRCHLWAGQRWGGRPWCQLGISWQQTPSPRARSNIVPAKIAIIGGSFGGLASAYELRRRLGPERARITLVSRDERFYFVPSFPWVALGGRSLAQISFDLAGPLARKQVGFAHETVTAIDIDAKAVITDRAELLGPSHRASQRQGGCWRPRPIRRSLALADVGTRDHRARRCVRSPPCWPTRAR